MWEDPNIKNDSPTIVSTPEYRRYSPGSRLVCGIIFIGSSGYFENKNMPKHWRIGLMLEPQKNTANSLGSTSSPSRSRGLSRRPQFEVFDESLYSDFGSLSSGGPSHYHTRPQPERPSPSGVVLDLMPRDVENTVDGRLINLQGYVELKVKFNDSWSTANDAKFLMLPLDVTPIKWTVDRYIDLIRDNFLDKYDFTPNGKLHIALRFLALSFSADCIFILVQLQVVSIGAWKWSPNILSERHLKSVSSFFRPGSSYYPVDFMFRGLFRAPELNESVLK